MTQTEEGVFLRDWDILATADFVSSGKHQHVALQFPDELLSQAPCVAAAISQRCQANVAVLADSAFHPEAVDEVAAQHMTATCIVHYGRASLGTTCSVPVKYVFPKNCVNCSDCASALTRVLQGMPAGSGAVIFFDQGLLHSSQDVMAQVNVQDHHTVVAQLAKNMVLNQTLTPAGPSHSTQTNTSGEPLEPLADGAVQEVAGYQWVQPVNLHTCCWVGPANSSSLQILHLALPQLSWHHIQVDMNGQVTEPGNDEDELRSQTALLKRRYFLVEKARSSAILGILVGTLASKELVQAMAHLRNLIRAAGKKSYTMLVGKTNPAKLANFPEVEVWIQLSEPLATITESRAYLSPVITPHEAVAALTGAVWMPGGPMVLGLTPLLCTPQEQQIQLAAAHGSSSPISDEDDHSSSDLIIKHVDGLSLGSRGGNHLPVAQPRHGAEFLQLRTWQGVEAPTVGAKVKAPTAAVQGLTGRAAVYDGEHNA